jgi:8-oxo-dGTP pyrophosphatase MutT (NUDIX family)
VVKDIFWFHSIIKIKVISYIYRIKNNKKELLVFTHVSFPEAGIQVVGGTVESGEDLKSALAREIFEESGLVINEIELVKIGQTEYFRKDKVEKNVRHYFEYHSQDLPDSWSHFVNSTGEDNGLCFNFYWLSCPEAKEQLTGSFGELLK